MSLSPIKEIYRHAAIIPIFKLHPSHCEIVTCLPCCSVLTEADSALTCCSQLWTQLWGPVLTIGSRDDSRGDQCTLFVGFSETAGLKVWRLDIPVSRLASTSCLEGNGLQILFSINKTEDGRRGETRVGGGSERFSLYLLLKKVHFFPRQSHCCGVRKVSYSSGKQQKLFQFCFSWSDQ